jgi:23S rRNA (guanosine2251-2'-O)-methyltransferase
VTCDLPGCWYNRGVPNRPRRQPQPQAPSSAGSPRDRYLTVYGRRPVLAALLNPDLQVDRVHLADNAEGASAVEIEEAARAAGVDLVRASPNRVKLLAGNGRHDQGVVADVVAPGMRSLGDWLDDAPETADVLVLDNVRTPANVGMILRTATAAGLAGVVVPFSGVSDLGPLVIKASAGVAFTAPILRTRTAVEALTLLRQARFRVYGLTGGAGTSLFDARFAGRAAFVLGNESDGLSEEARRHVQVALRIPMSGAVESLNVASAAAVLSFELLRRRLAVRSPADETSE